MKNDHTISIWNYTDAITGIIFDTAKKNGNEILANSNKKIYRVKIPYSYVFKNFLNIAIRDSNNGASLLSICDIVLS